MTNGSSECRPADPSESPAEFRTRLQLWIAEHVNPELKHAFDPAHRRNMTRALYDAGFMGVTWPREYGGRALPAEYQTIVNKELGQFSWAILNSIVTVGICARTLLDFGTEKHRLDHIPRMLRGDESWTQLLSEPGAGSDLASASTNAVLDGEDYVLNGQKVWTSGALAASYAIALVRTDPSGRRHAGLSAMIVDMKAPGVDIRPLREMTGSALFNEIFLDDVHTSATNLLGPLNDGWQVVSRMLTHERFALSAGTDSGRVDHDAFPTLLARARERGVLADPAVREALADVFIQQRLLDYLGVGIREAVQAKFDLGPVGSLGKLGTARASRAAAEAGMLIGGMEAQAWAAGDLEGAEQALELLHFPKTGIAGGTTEIQKNIVSERLLGLPRERK